MELTPDAKAMLERVEADVTRSVTAAVTADLERRHATVVAERDARIAALEQENASLHEELHEIRRRLERWSSHPAVRIARALRRVVR